jgi:hypothetical protein
MNKALFIIGLLVFIFSCDSDKKAVTVSPTPKIDSVITKKVWNILSPLKKSVEAVVTDAQGVETVNSVQLMVEDEGGAVVFRADLYDDGSQLYPEAGDIFGKDGVFRNLIVPANIVQKEGSYTFKMIAEDENENQSFPYLQPVTFVRSAAPDVINVNTPSSIPSGSAHLQFEVSVVSSDGEDAIQTVGFHIYDLTKSILYATKEIYSKETHLTKINADTTHFIYQIDSSFNAGKKGWYQFEFYSVNTADEVGVTMDKQILLENKEGSIQQLSLADTLRRPSQTLIQALVTDPQGLSDIDSVYFLSKKPNGEYANNGNPFLLKDNGDMGNGDSASGDGIYAMIIQISAANTPGVYVFEFYLRDKAGNRSEVVRKNIEVI